MSDLRDFTGKNRRFTGTDAITVPSGTTAQEPGNGAAQVRYDTDKGVLTYNDGSAWYKVSSAIPTLTSITGTVFVGQNKTLTLNGTNFLTSNLVVTFTHSGIDYTVTVTPTSDTSADVDTPNALESAVSVGDTVSIKVTNSDSVDSGSLNVTVDALAFGSQSFTSPGSYNWTAPSDVEEVSVVVVGGGGGSAHGNSSGGGGGGGLAYRNAIPVTPGASYPIVVGAGGAGLNSGNYTSGPFTGNSGGGSSAFSCTAGGGGSGNTAAPAAPGGSGGSPGGTNSGGGSGGAGGTDNNNSGGPGGGGAGGYSGNGGRGGSNDSGNNGGIGTNGQAGSGGGGGGGAAGINNEGGGGGGGGVGILGAGPNGSTGSGGGSNPTGGGGGSGGSNGQNGHQPNNVHPVSQGGDGGNYGGGSGGNNAGEGQTGGGAGGAVRIIYGYTSGGTKASYPNNAQN